MTRNQSPVGYWRNLTQHRPLLKRTVAVARASPPPPVGPPPLEFLVCKMSVTPCNYGDRGSVWPP